MRASRRPYNPYLVAYSIFGHIPIFGRYLAKVSDFGLASGTQGSTMRTTADKTGAGTFAYKAPECFEDEPFTTASEVYAFAICAWEVVTAEVPWKDYSAAQLMRAMVMEKERPSLPAEVKGAPSGAMIERCWAQDPVARPTFAALASQLTSALNALRQQPLTFATSAFKAEYAKYPPADPNAISTPAQKALQVRTATIGFSFCEMRISFCEMRIVQNAFSHCLSPSLIRHGRAA